MTAEVLAPCETGECAMNLDGRIVGVKMGTILNPSQSQKVEACKIYREGILEQNPDFPSDVCPFAAIQAAVATSMSKRERTGEK